MRKHLGSFYCTYLQSYMCTYACLGVEIIRDFSSVQFSSVQLLSCVQQLGSLRPHGLQHSSLLCPSPALRTRSNSCPSSWWCHPTISSSVVPFSSCLQFFPASGSFPMSQLLCCLIICLHCNPSIPESRQYFFLGYGTQKQSKTMVQRV